MLSNRETRPFLEDTLNRRNGHPVVDEASSLTVYDSLLDEMPSVVPGKGLSDGRQHEGASALDIRG